MTDLKAFLAGAALRRSRVSVRGMDLIVRQLTITERAEFLRLSQQNPTDGLVYMFRVGCINEDGSPFFADVAESVMADMPPDVVDAVAVAVLGASGMTEEARKND